MKQKVLILIHSLRYGGMELAALSFQQHMDPSRFDFTYYLQSNDHAETAIADRIASSGARVIVKPASVQGKFAEYRYLKRLFREEKFDVVHDHLGFHGGLTVRAAYAAGVPKRVSHSHFSKENRSMGLGGKLYHFLMRRWLNRYATDRLACSTEASEYLYSASSMRGVQCIGNGIECARYSYSAEKRLKKRAELGLENRFTVVHIGSIYWIKNQKFLISVFAEILKKIPDAVLLLCGEIRDDGECEKLAVSLGISERVRFLGTRGDIPELLMASDVLIFPSVFEALPIVPIEAQATGLPCLLSDWIVSEVQKNQNVASLSLDAPIKEWAETAIKLADESREDVDTSAVTEEFDIDRIAKTLEKIYEN